MSFAHLRISTSAHLKTYAMPAAHLPTHAMSFAHLHIYTFAHLPTHALCTFAYLHICTLVRTFAH